MVRIERAHAKVNLLLHVGEKRTDGYHEVATVLHFLELHDTVRIEVDGGADLGGDVNGDADGSGGIAGADRRGGVPAGVPDVRVRADRSDVPRDLDNLAGKAAWALLPELASRGLAVRSIRIGIEKRIPAAAGLGGGSADAAAALRGLNRLFRLDLDEASLFEVGAAIGSDVPACVAGGTVYCRGRGEQVVARVRSKPLWWVLANPGTPLATKDVYGALESSGGLGKIVKGPGSVGVTEDPVDDSPVEDSLVADSPVGRLDEGIEQLMRALEAGDAGKVSSLLHNDLEAPARRLEPEIDRLLEAMKEAGALASQVSGSGPTVFGLAQGPEQAEAIAARMRPTTAWVWWGPSAGR